MLIKHVIKRKVAMATFRAVDGNGQPSIHSIKYRRMDGPTGYKHHVSKSFQHLPGAAKFRGNMNTNHELLFVDHGQPGCDEPDPESKHFRIKIDLLIQVDGHTIGRTNGDFG